jgi:hypothetical protein
LQSFHLINLDALAARGKSCADTETMPTKIVNHGSGRAKDRAAWILSSPLRLDV